MSNDERRESIESGYAWMRLFIFGVAVAAIIFYQAHPEQFGRFGRDGIFLGVGSLLALATWLDVRSGSCSLIVSTFKRSEDSTGFWTYVAINGAIGGLFAFGALGDLLGLWRF
jgi:hypothetical protein